MATYLQGVTDYIPDYQPFQPDLNFYANVLQTKQTQYDTNWKQLNNLYGQIYNADLTHDLNIKKKDELVKQIDFNLKRVSALDLSLEQNVNQAMQVFRPFYEDQYLMKDMAWTKNFKNTYSTAQALASSPDAAQANKYWDGGMRGLEYRREMFKEATLDETLNFQNVTYVPKVNVLEEYMNFAKKYNIGMVTQTPEGLYLVERKNGAQIIPNLKSIFNAYYANRPDIQRFYGEAAFVERMDYAHQNADKYDGNKLEAEREYLRDKYRWLQNYAAKQNVEATNELETATNVKQNQDRDIIQNKVNPANRTYMEMLDEWMNVSTDNAKTASELNSKLNTENTVPSVESTNPGEENLLNNIELARLTIDAGYASYKKDYDIEAAAGTYATSNYEIKYKPDAVALQRLRDANAMARLNKSHQYKKELEGIKHRNKGLEEMVKIGRAHYNPDGSITPDPAANGYENIIIDYSGFSGQAGGNKINFDDLQQSAVDQAIVEKAMPGINSMMTRINALVNAESGNQFSNRDLGRILNNFYPDNETVDKIIEEGANYSNQNGAKEIWNELYKEYSNGNKEEFAKKMTKTGSIFYLNNSMHNFAKKHPGHNQLREYVSDPSIQNLSLLDQNNRAMESVQNSNTQKVSEKFKKYIDYASNKANEKATGNQKITDQDKKKAVEYLVNEYITSGFNFKTMKDNSGTIDKNIQNILGFTFQKEVVNTRDKNLLEYLPGVAVIEGLYDAATGSNQEIVGGSWTEEMLNKSYNELIPELKSFVPYSSISGDIVSMAAGTQTVKVDIDYPGDFGHQATVQAINDALKLPMGDDTKFKFGFSPNIPTNEDGEADYSMDGLDDNIARALLTQLKNSLGDKSVGDFMLSSGKVAMENSDLGFMKFNIPRKVIDAVVTSLPGNEEYKGYDLDRYRDEIAQKGLYVIAPHEYFSNKLFNASDKSAGEYLLEAENKIEYRNPHKAGGYLIEKTTGVPGQDYSVKVNYRVLDNKTGEVIEDTKFLPFERIRGKKLDEIQTTLLQALNALDAQNLQVYREFHRLNEIEKIEKADKELGTPENKSYWTY